MNPYMHREWLRSLEGLSFRVVFGIELEFKLSRFTGSFNSIFSTSAFRFEASYVGYGVPEPVLLLTVKELALNYHNGRMCIHIYIYYIYENSLFKSPAWALHKQLVSIISCRNTDALTVRPWVH